MHLVFQSQTLEQQGVFENVRVIDDLCFLERKKKQKKNKNRPDSNRNFQVYFKSGVIEYVRTSRYTRRAPIHIRGNSSPNTWLFVQCLLTLLNKTIFALFLSANNAEICQLAAIHGTVQFNVYILPLHGITPTAAAVNRL